MKWRGSNAILRFDYLYRQKCGLLARKMARFVKIINSMYRTETWLQPDPILDLLKGPFTKDASNLSKSKPLFDTLHIRDKAGSVLS